MENQVVAGKYRLIRILGKGGMGSVWLAEHLTLHTPVAVKLIDAEMAKNPGARARFDREAQLAARIRSAHVVKILDHGVTDDGLPYIAMESLAGESLRERLSARGRLTPAETAKIVSHICRALSRAHEAGLVHRDLKPENIFMAREDDGEIVKILDFGVAKATDMLAATGMDPTRTGTLLGTPYYMSPEQAQGLKSVDYRSDLWSVGVVAFECLVAKRPFTAPALGILIAKIMGAPAPTMAQSAPDANVSPELEAWMRKALCRDPAARFASAKELSDTFMIAAGAVDTMDRGSLGDPLVAAAPSSPNLAASDPDLVAEMAATIALAPPPRAVSSPSFGAPLSAPTVDAALTMNGTVFAETPAMATPAAATPFALAPVPTAAPAARSLFGVVVVLSIALVLVTGVLLAVLLR